jgi:hypothetical protein
MSIQDGKFSQKTSRVVVLFKGLRVFLAKKSVINLIKWGSEDG